MRIITFQSKHVIKDMLKSDVYKFNSKGRRSRKEDCNAKERLYPFYGFVSIPYRKGSALNILAIVRNWSRLIGFYELDRRDMVELEIPDNFVAKIRSSNSNIELTSKDIYSYYEDDIDAIFYEIRKEWIVAIHESSNNETGYNKRNIKVRVISNYHKPLISKSYWVSGSDWDSNLENKLPDRPPIPTRCIHLSAYVNSKGYYEVMKELFEMYLSKEEVDKYFSNTNESAISFFDYSDRFDNVVVCY